MESVTHAGSSDKATFGLLHILKVNIGQYRPRLSELIILYYNFYRSEKWKDAQK